MRHLYSCLLVLLLASLCAHAETTPHWTEVHSPHFTVLTDASEKDARRTAIQFERMRAVFHLLLPQASDDAAAPILVLALRDKKSFRTLEPEAYLAKNSLDLAGYFLRAQDRNYVLLRLDTEGDHPYATVYHEYTHYMLRKTGEWMPLWLGEGLAEFYQNTTLQEKDTRLGEPSVYDIEYLRQNRLIPLATLLKVDHDSPYYHDEQKGSIFYSESWALTHYLEIADRKNGTHLIQDYATLLSRHQDAVTAAQQVFGDLKTLERSLDAYVHQQTYTEFKLIVPLVFDESGFQARPVSTSQANAIRADVLLDVNRVSDARALLESVLQADPGNALAHETMGSLKFRQHDLPGARKWYGEAVQLDSQSYLAHYYFAVMSLSANDRDHDDAIEQSLKASIKINPRFAPAYDALSEFYASRHEKLDEAHLLNATAVQIEPENLAYRLNGAQILAENNHYDDAIRVLENARHLAKTLDETGSVDRRLTDLERYKASLKESEQMRARNDRAEVTHVDLTHVTAETKEPDYPAGPPTGPHHTISGVIHDVKCLYPTILTMDLVTPGKSISLYTNNYFKVIFTTANYTSNEDLQPCTAIEKMKARIEFGEVKDSRVAGQLLSVELSK